ncbi:hypothetical protein [Loktanella salsilacus]|jgi:hypothetical protein|uniref:hypothetical protein n=1 Tax=Loktanella salsilacus TaxID=195913 RepID=UPI0037045530
MSVGTISDQAPQVDDTVLAPHVAYGVEAGLRYSDPQEIRNRLKKIEMDYVA